MLHIIIDAFRNTILITGLVVVMMMMIEALNIESRGLFFRGLKKTKIGQVVFGALLGILPGCMGGFAAVSLYTHRLFSFGALVAMMIASSGDEAFVMLAMIPQEALILFAILFVIAVITGILTDIVHDKLHKKHCDKADHEDCHDKHENTNCGETYQIHENIKHNEKKRSFTWKRICIFIGLLVFILALGAGYLEHDHAAHTCTSNHTTQTCSGNHTTQTCNDNNTTQTYNGNHTTQTCSDNHTTQTYNGNHTTQTCSDNHSHNHPHTDDTHICCEHGNHTKHTNTADDTQNSRLQFNLLNETWMNILFAGLSIIMLFVIAFADNHFIEEHIWKHIIKKHLLSIFLWTLGVLLAVSLSLQYFDIQNWLSQNVYLMILLAVLIGIIPESGPHMAFCTLFAAGLIPFPVLLASSISQDGHASIPLLAETKIGFLKAKAINCLVALICGFLSMLFF